MLTTNRLVLRTPRVSGAADVLAMLRDPDTVRWNPAPAVVDLDTAADWCIRAADWSAGDHAAFSAIDASTGRYLGNVSVHSVDRVQSDAEIGYRIAPWARGRHYATEAVTTATAWAFDVLSLVRIELVHAAVNAPSCVVATRAGYPLEGVLRQSFV